MSEITVHYLEMTNPDKGGLKSLPVDLCVEEACIKQYKVNRMLYDLVGEGWQWNDKADWTPEKWKHYSESDALRTWIATHRGSIAGYFELQKLDAATNEIAYFGLAEKFIGRGYGGSLLSEAIRQAWLWGDVERIIVNTCTHDHPNALANYKARGFSVYQEKTEVS